MVELDLMVSGLLFGVIVYFLVIFSLDFGLVNSVEEEDMGFLGSFYGEVEGQGSSFVSYGGFGVEGEGEILCDFCFGVSRVRVVKFCLICMVNYCEEYLRLYQENSKLYSYQLTESVKERDLRICFVYYSSLVVFCYYDQQCICQECGQSEYRGYFLVFLDVVRRDKEVSVGVYLGDGDEETMSLRRGQVIIVFGVVFFILGF